MAAKKIRILLPRVEPPNWISNNRVQQWNTNGLSKFYLYIYLNMSFLYTQKKRPLERKWWKGEEGGEKTA